MRAPRRRRAGAAVAASIAAAALAATAAALTPSDPLAGHPAYSALNLPAAWEIETGAPGIVIAVVDSGVEAAHPDLAGAVEPGYDFVADRPDVVPVDGHGTAVAGVAAARAGNGVGGVGVCFDCHVLPLQVLGSDGIALNVDIAKAIDYAVGRGAAVVNISLIGPNSPPELRRAIARARAAGVLVVAAAGNDASNVPRFPAAIPGTISVGAATDDGRRASFSNWGPWVGFAASECAPVAVLGGGAGIGCGTSMSSPLVAGVVALMRAYAPHATPDEIELSLARTSRPITGVRHGIPDAAAALRDLGSPPRRLQPVVLGQAAVDRELEAFSGLWVGLGVHVDFEWQRCDGERCAPIAGARGRTYVPGSADAGHRLLVTASADGLDSTASAKTTAVESRPRDLARPTITGTPRIGARLTASPGRWAGEGLRLTIVWQRCRAGCEDVAIGRRYLIRASDRGSALRLRVEASNSVGTAVALSAKRRVR